MKKVKMPPPSGRGRQALMNYDAVVDRCNENPGEWFMVGTMPYESAITASKTLRRRGLQAVVRGEDRKSNGPADVYASTK